MKKIFIIICALILVGAGCERSIEYQIGADSDLEYDYSWGEYDSIPEAVVDAPEVVQVGEVFEIKVDIVHSSNEVQYLHSVDIGETYLNGVAVISSDPNFSEVYLLDDGTYTHFLGVDIPANGLALTFNAVALKVGNWQGAFDICFDDGLNCGFYTIQTEVN